MEATAASAQGFESETLDSLYRAHYPSMMRLGFLLTGSNETAEDLVHDVFVRAGRHLPLDHAPSYLRVALVNACRSHGRRMALARRLRSPAPPLVMPRELVEFRDVLLRLPVRRRAAIVLRYFCELGDVEIAELLQCEPSTVRSLVHRGLADLREVLE